MSASKTGFVIRLLFQAVRRALRVGRDRHLLAAMSERELRDLGIGRSQVAGLLQGLPRDGKCTNW